MTIAEAELQSIWSMLDRDHLAQVARRGPPPVFATISGAHLYGFPSPDSDVDLRGAFLLPARQMLGLNPPKETISIMDDSQVDLDWVAHDIRKFARMLCNHNGYVMEQLYSPLVVLSTPAHAELKTVAQGCITRPTVRHYRGFARGRRHRLREPNPTVKHLLYAYRVLLTGIHLMKSGEVVANINTLNLDFQLSEVAELVARKSAGMEKEALLPSELAQHEQLLDRLEVQLDQAHADSHLPEEPTNAAELNELVLSLRLAEL